jgi:hypothetical protein
MSHELYVFAGSALVAVAAGFIVRLLSLADGESVGLKLFDFTRDLFAAAAAVFPTTLIIQSKPDQTIQFSSSQLGVTLTLIAAIALWAKGDSRYFSYWRQGMKRVRNDDGTLSEPEAADSPGMRKAMAFVAGNGLGFAVLFASAVVSYQVAS